MSMKKYIFKASWGFFEEKKEKNFKQTLFVPPKACANGGYSLTEHLIDWDSKTICHVTLFSTPPMGGVWFNVYLCLI